MDKKDIKKWFEDIGLVNGLEKMAWVQKEFIEPAVHKVKSDLIEELYEAGIKNCECSEILDRARQKIHHSQR